MKRTRDFKAEYRQRIERALAKGLSRSQGRGHARAGERPNAGPMPVERTASLERALKLMKGGATQAKAAKAEGVAPQKLRRFIKENTEARRVGRSWIIIDRRPVTVVMATKAKVRDVTVPYDVASDIARHWVAVNKFLETNNATFLAPFAGKGIRDSAGTFHQFETWPNVLRKLDAIGELNFIDIYSDVAGGEHG